MITNTDVTVYNRVYDREKGANAYYRTVLKGVNWQDNTKIQPGDPGVVRADVAEIYIPFLVDTEKNYLSPVNFAAAEDKAGFFTLTPDDILVKGVVTDEIEKTKDVERLKSKYDHVRVAAMVETNDNGSPGMQHWKVSAQ